MEIIIQFRFLKVGTKMGMFTKFWEGLNDKLDFRKYSLNLHIIREKFMKMSVEKSTRINT